MKLHEDALGPFALDLLNALDAHIAVLDPARSFLEPGGISLQPITLELPVTSPDRPEVKRASRASSQHFE